VTIKNSNGAGLLALALALALPAHCAAQPSSLYRAQSYQALITDHRARRIGDSLVVLVYETATATNQTDTKVNKSSNIDIGASDNHNKIGGKFNATSDADGGGIERRSGQVVAQVSATVIAVTERGDYVIQGEQHIYLNSESQVITVAGRVRPQDIDSNNTVISTRIADAKIEFLGQGLLSAREKPGIVTRLFNWLF
jgi:flagellar L-ring protein precursor FlgH